jgi:hypothetical protein
MESSQFLNEQLNIRRRVPVAQPSPDLPMPVGARTVAPTVPRAQTEPRKSSERDRREVPGPSPPPDPAQTVECNPRSVEHEEETVEYRVHRALCTSIPAFGHPIQRVLLLAGRPWWLIRREPDSTASRASPAGSAARFGMLPLSDSKNRPPDPRTGMTDSLQVPIEFTRVHCASSTRPTHAAVHGDSRPRRRCRESTPTPCCSRAMSRRARFRNIGKGQAPRSRASSRRSLPPHATAGTWPRTARKHSSGTRCKIVRVLTRTHPPLICAALSRDAVQPSRTRRPGARESARGVHRSR